MKDVGVGVAGGGGGSVCTGKSLSVDHLLGFNILGPLLLTGP